LILKLKLKLKLMLAKQTAPAHQHRKATKRTKCLSLCECSMLTATTHYTHITHTHSKPLVTTKCKQAMAANILTNNPAN